MLDSADTKEVIPVAPGVDNSAHDQGFQKSIEEGLRDATGEDIKSGSTTPPAIQSPVVAVDLDSDPQFTTSLQERWESEKGKPLSDDSVHPLRILVRRMRQLYSGKGDQA